jgi:hypothetical protein
MTYKKIAPIARTIGYWFWLGLLSALATIVFISDINILDVFIYAGF